MSANIPGLETAVQSKPVTDFWLFRGKKAKSSQYVEPKLYVQIIYDSYCNCWHHSNWPMTSTVYWEIDVGDVNVALPKVSKDFVFNVCTICSFSWQQLLNCYASNVVIGYSWLNINWYHQTEHGSFEETNPVNRKRLCFLLFAMQTILLVLNNDLFMIAPW